MTVECPICFEKFDSFRGLNGHMNRHRPKRKRAESQTMDCPICGEVCLQVSAVDFVCPDCETLWTKMQGDGFTYLEAEDMPTFVNDEGVETPLTELEVFGEVFQLSCPLCAYTPPPVQVGSAYCDECGDSVNSFELQAYCLVEHPEAIHSVIEDEIDALNEAEFYLLESHPDFCPAIRSGHYTVEDIEDNL